jgi:diadenylate cyclase
VASRDERVLAVLQKVAPGTALREGIDRIIKAGKGAIIVIGEDAVEPLVSGGFRLATKFSAQRLSEVAKMDGAIVVDEDIDKIIFANVQLVPDPAVPTSETGTRHRTAERVARQTGKPVISVSESMRIVTVYIDDTKHVLEEISSILFRANQALSTLERYRIRLDEVSSTLMSLELENVVTLRDVLLVLQRAEMLRRIADEIEAYVAELGSDGRLLQLQLDELMHQVQSERTLVVRDYQPDRRRKLETILKDLDAIPAERLLDLTTLALALGQGHVEDSYEELVSPRGYRLLSRVPRLSERMIERLIAKFGSLQRLLGASLTELDDVEGIGETRARQIREGLTRLAEAAALERYS